LSPKAIKRQQALGELALRNNDAASAERALDKAVQLGRHSVYNHPSIHAGLAKAKTAGGKHDDALEVLDKMSATFDHDPEAAFYTLLTDAEIRQNRGEPEAAAASLAAAEEAFAGVAGNQSARLSLNWRGRRHTSATRRNRPRSCRRPSAITTMTPSSSPLRPTPSGRSTTGTMQRIRSSRSASRSST